MEINNLDLWTLLICTFRYSMGRSTYMPSVCVDMFRQYKDFLMPSQRNQIVEEVKKEIEIYEATGRTLGAECDHQLWRNFVISQGYKIDSPPPPAPEGDWNNKDGGSQCF